MAPAVVARAQARASVPLTRPRFARSQPVARGERSEARGTASPGIPDFADAQSGLHARSRPV